MNRGCPVCGSHRGLSIDCIVDNSKFYHPECYDQKESE